MSELFFLSIIEEYAQQILAGTKRWEFRENPEFGKAGDYTLRIGDRILIISTGNLNTISGYCIVDKIIKGKEYRKFFVKDNSEVWKYTGCPEDNEDASVFKEQILKKYKTAVRLKVITIRYPIDISSIKHLWTGKKWSGRGFGHISQLKRYGICGTKLKDYINEIMDGSV